MLQIIIISVCLGINLFFLTLIGFSNEEKTKKINVFMSVFLFSIFQIGILYVASKINKVYANSIIILCMATASATVSTLLRRNFRRNFIVTLLASNVTTNKVDKCEYPSISDLSKLLILFFADTILFSNFMNKLNINNINTYLIIAIMIFILGFLGAKCGKIIGKTFEENITMLSKLIIMILYFKITIELSIFLTVVSKIN